MGSGDAYVQIKCSPGSDDLIANRLKHLKHIKSIYGVSGDKDLIVYVIANDIREPNRHVDEIRKVPGIENTETYKVLRSYK